MYMKAFLMKFVMITLVLWVVLGIFYDVSIPDILVTSVVLSVVGYVGDIFILPKIGNVWATISDFVLAYAVIYFLGSTIYEQPMALGSAAFISALLLMIGELYLHRYMHTNIFEPKKSNPDEKTGYYNRTNLQTEFADEVDIDALANQGREKRADKKF
ncbi:YndM family protein [Psychrobacillus sp. NPDC096623]|uniref:YndM family protein n=1 Tax=Psychrobacillus sp. NPDC096623 TaxID=3364492 RepID=UPI0038008FC4